MVASRGGFALPALCGHTLVTTVGVGAQRWIYHPPTLLSSLHPHPSQKVDWDPLKDWAPCLPSAWTWAEGVVWHVLGHCLSPLLWLHHSCLELRKACHFNPEKGKTLSLRCCIRNSTCLHGPVDTKVPIQAVGTGWGQSLCSSGRSTFRAGVGTRQPCW